MATQVRALAETPPDVDITWLIRLLDGALAGFNDHPDLKQRLKGVYGFVITARKWLSGLESASTDPTYQPIFDHEESAFYDLDISQLGKSGSVLHDVNRFPLARIKHAAIVGTDGQLDTLTLSGVESAITGRGGLWRWLYRLLARPRLSPVLRALFGIAGAAYTTGMNEQTLPEPVDESIARRLDDFASGVRATDPRYRIQTEDDIGPRAHDFVIPSAYQLIEAGDIANVDDAFLGNWINPQASHLAGGDPRLGARASQKYLLEILRTMAE